MFSTPVATTNHGILRERKTARVSQAVKPAAAVSLSIATIHVRCAGVIDEIYYRKENSFLRTQRTPLKTSAVVPNVRNHCVHTSYISKCVRDFVTIGTKMIQIKYVARKDHVVLIQKKNAKFQGALFPVSV